MAPCLSRVRVEGGSLEWLSWRRMDVGRSHSESTQPWILEAGFQGVEKATSFCSEKLGRRKDLTWGGLRGVIGMGAASWTSAGPAGLKEGAQGWGPAPRTLV